jgi:uncharacterized protein (DUF2147 family)
MISFRINLQLTILISILLPVFFARGADTVSPVGTWKNDDATFEITEDQGKLSGKIVALRESRTPDGQKKTDIHNPDPGKRQRPIIGLVFLSGFTQKSSTRWENGTVYDPKSGNTYSASMELDGPEKVNMRGFIGISLIGRTDVWTRVHKD